MHRDGFLICIEISRQVELLCSFQFCFQTRRKERSPVVISHPGRTSNDAGHGSIAEASGGLQISYQKEKGGYGLQGWQRISPKYIADKAVRILVQPRIQRIHYTRNVPKSYRQDFALWR